MADSHTEQAGAPEAVSQLLDSLSPARRGDAELLISIMSRVTGQPPVLHGKAIGFGQYRYTYASGREGDAATISFAMRASTISIYFMDGLDAYRATLERLGPHRAAVGCLTIKKLADVDLAVLESMITTSVQKVTARAD